MSETKKALGGKILTGPFLLLTVLFSIGVYFAIQRFALGIGAVTNAVQNS